MALLSYNGISLPYSDLTRFRQDVMYDPEGRTDAYLSRFDIEVQCVINLQYIDQLLPEDLRPNPGEGFTAAGNAASIMQYIQTRLMQPRKFLSVIFNNVELIPKVQANAGFVDSDNGPKPIYADPTLMTDTMFLLVFRIHASYFINAGYDATTQQFRTVRAGSPVLYNRWMDAISIDNCNYTRRIRQGRYAIRSDNSQRATIDTFRPQMAVMGIPGGFVRESTQYTVDPSGLALTYTIVDKEVYKLPPFPAFEADGEYVETTVNNGTIKRGMCRVRLRGSKTTPQNRLAERAMGICARKLRMQGAQLGGAVGDQVRPFGILNKAVVATKLYENEVECVMDVLMHLENTRGRFHGISQLQFSRNFGETPGSEANQASTPNHLLRGTENYLMEAAAYFDPSLQNQFVDQATNNLNRGLVPGQAGTQQEV